MTLLYFLVVIGILVFVHELGHFVMARRMGVRVEKFSLGMGPKLFGVKRGDTEYLVSALPLGGYVKMAGEHPDETTTGAPDEFPSKTPWQRALIVATGPLTNIVLAFLIMPLVFMVGTYSEGPAKIGFVEKGSAAEQAGFLAGDVITAINGRSIGDWTKAISLIAVNPDTDVSVTIDRNGSTKNFTLRPVAVSELRIGNAGIVPDIPVEIGRLMPGMPAEEAGIKTGDKILSANGITMYHWNQFSAYVKEGKGAKLVLVTERAGERRTVTVTPREKEGRFLIGVEPAVRLVLKKHGFIESVRLGFHKTVESIDLTFITLKKLLSFGLSIKTLGGPVMIAQMSGQAAEAGLAAFLGLLAIVSVSLGVLNLLPIPVLDGGMLVFLAIEAVRKRPLSTRVMEVSQGIGAALLISLIVVVSYNDVMRMFFSK